MKELKFSFFPNNRADKPGKQYGLEEFLEQVKEGTWAKEVLQLRKASDTHTYKRLKDRLPAVTISAQFNTRNKFKTLAQKLKHHTGLICLDVDKKDNPRMRVKDLIDRDAVAEFISAGGEGKKIIYRCKPVKSAEEHRRIFDAAILRLQKKGINIKVDPIVKSIASLQYVTFDPQAYHNPKSALVLEPLPPVKRKIINRDNVKGEMEQLEEYVKALGNKDITHNYENWMLVLFGLSYTLGEQGRAVMHKICKHYKSYSKIECDEKYDSFLETPPNQISKPVTLNTVFHIINEHLSVVDKKRLGKKYSITHAVGEATDVEEQGDLRGLVRFKLFLFRKVIDKNTKTIVELIPCKINLNAFEALLKQMGFFRYDGGYVHIVENIVEQVDALDIIRILTEHIEREGDYNFVYKNTEYKFSWEELAHFWRENRAASSMHNQIAASLTHWQENLLKDTGEESYIPYANGVVRVNKKEIKLIPYKQIKEQVWKERILPRPFVYTQKRGMFEEFFANVMGRGKDSNERLKSTTYKRSLWYYGYMLQGSKRQSTARAWLLYDIRPGNNGRTGKTIIGTAVGKIRSVTVIDGKTLDLKNRFAFQTVEPWTDIVFIDDPSKYVSIVPLFNMISGTTSADKKGTSPIVKPLKFMIASNWVLEAGESSEAGRQFVSQLDDYYLRMGKGSITPIVDLHGKEFFTDWNDSDWSAFDSFSMRALQYHLAGEVPENTIVGSSAIIRFIQTYEEELFFNLRLIMKEYAEGQNKIQQQLLTMVVKDNDQGKSMNRAGKIAREFLTACGAKNIHPTTMKVQGRAVQAYAWEGKLDFGKYNNV